MARPEEIFNDYIERLSGTIMEQYRNLLRMMIRGPDCVYALNRGERLY